MARVPHLRQRRRCIFSPDAFQERGTTLPRARASGGGTTPPNDVARFLRTSAPSKLSGTKAYLTFSTVRVRQPTASLILASLREPHDMLLVHGNLLVDQEAPRYRWPWQPEHLVSTGQRLNAGRETGEIACVTRPQTAILHIGKAAPRLNPHRDLRRGSVQPKSIRRAPPAMALV